VRLPAASAFAIALALGACSTVAPVKPVASINPQADTIFGIDGRLSARHGDDAVAVGFVWRHDPPADALTVTSPLGHTLAELSSDTDRNEVEIVLADGRRERAADWPALTSRTLGFSLPVAGLSAWILALPHSRSPWTVEPDGQGRAEVLRQDGWEIVYTYPDDIARRPSRLRLGMAEIEMRIVIDRWH
jgi:outer membrane lipoprotein LolB